MQAVLERPAASQQMGGRNYWAIFGIKTGEYLASQISRETCEQIYFGLSSGAKPLAISGATPGTLGILTPILIRFADIGMCDRCHELQIVENCRKFVGLLQRVISRLPEQQLHDLYKFLLEFDLKEGVPSTNHEIVHKVCGWLLNAVESEYIVGLRQWVTVN
jgi:hypothetical protein